MAKVENLLGGKDILTGFQIARQKSREIKDFLYTFGHELPMKELVFMAGTLQPHFYGRFIEREVAYRLCALETTVAGADFIFGGVPVDFKVSFIDEEKQVVSIDQVRKVDNYMLMVVRESGDITLHTFDSDKLDELHDLMRDSHSNKRQTQKSLNIDLDKYPGVEYWLDDTRNKKLERKLKLNKRLS